MMAERRDDLPEPENMAEAWYAMPPLSPPLIEGVLRQGGKMIMAGPSKAGKSYALIELCAAIAEGKPWMGFPCAAGRVLYVNLELERPSCLHRFQAVYKAMGQEPDHIDRIDVWNLRGHSAPLSALVPDIIRRGDGKDYIAVIIDPAYKVIGGDENNAKQMSDYCGQLDRICTALHCAVIYCHHHSKGRQGGKSSMDRASGSGVFARDADALIDMIELSVGSEVRYRRAQEAAIRICREAIRDAGEEPGQYGTLEEALEAVRSAVWSDGYRETLEAAEEARRAAEEATAWRIEGTLREFRRFRPVNVWFEHPVHLLDRSGDLDKAEPEGDTPGWKRAMQARKPREVTRQERQGSIAAAFDAVEAAGGKVTVARLANEMGCSEKTVRNRIKEHGGFRVENNEVRKKQ